MIEIRRYTPEDAAEWNNFIWLKSRQGTFLFDRNYMDYHQDRFHDHSLMFFHKKKLYALLPANEMIETSQGETSEALLGEASMTGSTKKILYSHQGLTYGGLLTCPKVTAEVCIDIFESLREYLRENGFQSCIYKAMPWIYQRIPSEEDLYALTHVAKAKLKAREISTTIPLDAPLRFSELRRRGIKKAERNELDVKFTKFPNDITAFWNLLDANLLERHHTHPVHSKEELELLMHRFPNNILCFVAEKDDAIVGGSIVYVTPQVIHTQYIAANEIGKQFGALDALFDFIIHKCRWNVPYFDFGKSTEDEGNFLNRNLIHQKEGFGGRGVIYDTYEWEI